MKHEIACELYINDNKELYYELERHQEEINEQISNDLLWQPLENKKASRIKLISDLNVDTNNETWSQAFEWLSNNIELFKNTFNKYLK